MDNKIEHTKKINWTGSISLSLDDNEKDYVIMEVTEYSSSKPHPFYGSRNKFLLLVLDLDDIEWMKSSLSYLEKKLESRR